MMPTASVSGDRHRGERCGAIGRKEVVVKASLRLTEGVLRAGRCAAVRAYMRSGISMPSSPMPVRTTLATFSLSTRRKARRSAFSSRRMLKSW